MPASANADGGYAGCDDEGCDATARDHGNGSSRDQPEPVICSYRGPIELDPGESFYTADGQPIFPDGTGQWFERLCMAGGVEVDRKMVYLRPGDLLQEARERVRFPTLPVSLSPPGEQTVNFRSLLWIDSAAWREVSATAALPGLSVTVTARPTRVVWSMGDGATVACDGPGVPYDPRRPESEQDTSCSYLYLHSSGRAPGGVYRLSAAVDWELSWSVSGGPGGGPLGTVTRATAPVAVRVVEVQPVNTRAGG